MEIRVRNVNQAWAWALMTIEAYGVPEDSRNGRVLVYPEPVVTITERPTERVLFDPVRDANPIFHLHEALWMLAGRNDARWLDQFVSDFSVRFAEPDGHMHGAYGHRWRSHFERDGTVPSFDPFDQLDEVVEILRSNPRDRQCVVQMWDAVHDLGVLGLRDRPCNTQIYLRVREEPAPPPPTALDAETMRSRRVLDLGVTCRSNDIVFGCYGANAVHFSILQEYLAARIGVGVGRMHQYSWNWHRYDWALPLCSVDSARESWRILDKDGYPGTVQLVDDPVSFDEEVRAYVNDPADFRNSDCSNAFLKDVALPMWMVNQHRKLGDYEKALRIARNEIMAPDWEVATTKWLRRRMRK